MDNVLIPALMFPALFALIFLGIPVAFSLISTAVVFGFLKFGPAVGLQAFGFIDDISAEFVLSAIPLFVFMGAMLERSGVAERLFVAMRVWLGRLPGGLAIATISMAAIFAAGTGIVGAVEALIGLMAIPAMLQQRYDKGLISGTICAGGSLGTIIPPSVLVIIYANVAQLSVGKLFMGVIFPGLLMVVLFIGYILLRSCIWPPPRLENQREEPRLALRQKLRISLPGLVPTLLLIVAVLGSILAGVATPTEAAGVGAVGTILLAVGYRTFTWRSFVDALRMTVIINAMIMLIIVGGTLFTTVFRIHGGGALVEFVIDALDLSPTGMMFVFLTIIFILGFFLDWVSIVLICIPIFAPLLAATDIDPLWFGIMVIVVIQTSYLTPPMAPAIFYLRAVAPPEITYRDMYRGVAPFVACQLLVLVIVYFFPAVGTYLPEQLVGR